jgi:hypothetical protein
MGLLKANFSGLNLHSPQTLKQAPGWGLSTSDLALERTGELYLLKQRRKEGRQ